MINKKSKQKQTTQKQQKNEKPVVSRSIQLALCLHSISNAAVTIFKISRVHSERSEKHHEVAMVKDKLWLLN